MEVRDTALFEMGNSMVFILVLVDAVTSTLLVSLVDGDGEVRRMRMEWTTCPPAIAMPMPIANPTVVKTNTHAKILYWEEEEFFSLLSWMSPGGPLWLYFLKRERERFTNIFFRSDRRRQNYYYRTVFTFCYLHYSFSVRFLRVKQHQLASGK